MLRCTLGQVREALERAAAAFPEEKEDDDMFGDEFGAGAVRCLLPVFLPYNRVVCDSAQGPTVLPGHGLWEALSSGAELLAVCRNAARGVGRPRRAERRHRRLGGQGGA